MKIIYKKAPNLFFKKEMEFTINLRKTYKMEKELYKLLNITDIKKPDFIRLTEESLFKIKIVRFEYKDKRRKAINFYTDIETYNKINDLLIVTLEEIISNK